MSGEVYCQSLSLQAGEFQILISTCRRLVEQGTARNCSKMAPTWLVRHETQALPASEGA